MSQSLRGLLAAVAIAIGLPSAVLAAAAPAPDATPAAVATPAAAAAPCATADLALREVEGAAPPGSETRYALANRGSAACRISGGVGIRLFDVHGDSIPLRVAPRTAMPMLLTLAPGEEASFTVAFGPHAPTGCITAARIEVYVAPQTTPLRATTTVSTCTSATMHISNLRLGVPSSVPAGSD